MIRTSVYLFLLLTTFLGSVCQSQTQSTASNTSAASSPSQRVILKVGDQQITEAAFEQYIADLEAQQGPADLSRKKLGENYASLLMLSQIAQSQNLESSPEVKRQLAVDRTQILSNAEFAKLKAQATPTDKEISDYYNSHLDDYDLVEVKRIFIWSGDGSAKDHTLTPQQAKALAAAVRRAYTTDGDVDKVLRDTPHGKEDVMADTQPLTFQSGELPGAMNDQIFSLKEGEWKEFDNGDAFAFFHVVKRSRRQLSEVSPQIAKKVQSEKLREQLSDLKSKTGIWMDETYFASKSPISPTSTEPASHQASSTTERGEK